MIVAFDVDDTLWKIRLRKKREGDCVYGCEVLYHPCGNYSMDQVPDYDLIQVLRWFYKNGDTVVIWSAGGIDYAEQIATKLGLNDMVLIVNKGESTIKPDITFDDQAVTMGKVNVLVTRNKVEEKYAKTP